MVQSIDTCSVSTVDTVYPDHHHFLPVLGTYVLFSLDLEGTLDFYCDDRDDIANAAVKETAGRFKQYVAHIFSVRITRTLPS
jgi:hypothetical protein